MIDEMTLPEAVRKRLNGRDPWQWLIDDLEKGCLSENNDVLEDVPWEAIR